LGKEALAVFGVHKGALAGVVLLATVSYLMYRHGSRQEENTV